MGKNKQKKSPAPVSPPLTPPSSGIPELIQKGGLVVSKLLANITQEFPAASSMAPSPDEIPPGQEVDALRQQLEQTLLRVQQTDKACEEIRERLLQREAKLQLQSKENTERQDRLHAEREEQEKKHKADRAELQKERTELQKERTELEKSRKELQDAQKALLDEKALLAQERANAESGFARERREALMLFDKELALLKEELSRQRTLLADERKQWLTEQGTGRALLREELNQAREAARQALFEEEQRVRAQWAQEQKELDEQRTQVRVEQQSLRLLKREADDARALLVDDREFREIQVRERSAGLLQQKELRIRELEERLQETSSTLQESQRRLRQWQEADRKFQGRTSAELLEELTEAQRQHEELQLRLEQQPGEVELQRLRQLVERESQWEDERTRLQYEMRMLRLQQERSQQGTVELENLRTVKESYVAQNHLLQTRLDEARAEMNALTAKASGTKSFPACSQMDEDVERQTKRETVRLSSLKEFIEDLHHRIAIDPRSDKRFFYTPADLQLFVAGLAASRLHIFQGISGIGKTSLAREFARAVNAGFRSIDVQANWRDRQDLLGHFNTFEGKYNETEFLKALYEAHCPVYEDRPFIILLDEMNLSRPEHYFANLLAQLEHKSADRKLELMPTRPQNPPKRLVEGHVLPLPPNVWFIGTANHDETTVEFADKTYDRAHVTELPDKPKPFKPEPRAPRLPVSLRWLQETFEEAAKQHASEAEKACAFLDKQLSTLLRERFGIGWGPRLRDQMRVFVPVVVAAGGKMGDATDHVLATRLLRKIRDRHDINAGDLEELKKAMSPWLDDSSPSRSVKLIEKEQQRLSVGGGR